MPLMLPPGQFLEADQKDVPDNDVGNVKGDKIMILDGLIKVGAENAITRETLAMITGAGDREIRELIHQMRRDVPVINLQNGEGYFIPDMSRPEEVEFLKKFVKQEEKRLKSIGWALKPARKMLREADVS